ncbi:MAG: Gfo/Idh/MocA family oxidoreductase [Candidatus Omnitrophica bacterium]|nr:Gfo/Idh/MocA family oxidoreductase [Candidatus Omnitrophota bacterium]
MSMPLDAQPLVSSAELAAALAATDLRGNTATVIGYGTMGQQFVQALRALHLRRVRVCSRSPQSIEPLKPLEGLEAISGGFEHLQCRPQPDELGIIATPTAFLAAAADRLAALGFRRLLIEKPIALRSDEIERLADRLERQGVDAACAYNRVSYPSFHEARARAAQDGGITSCTYTFTEMIKPDWPQRFPAEELRRWGIANSLHVMSMAHGLIGWPSTWNGQRAGSLPWHPTGAVFVGSGVSVRGIPFSYHADWGSTGRWSVELHTAVSSYRFCPLEQCFRRTSALGVWEEVPVAAFAPEIKVGIVEEVAAMLDPGIRAGVPLMSLRDAAVLTRFGESVFGYDD